MSLLENIKITYYAAASIDGFIAKEDGDVSWLDDLDIDMADTGYEEFFATIDGLIMGRGTYDFIFNYGLWPYQDKPAWVCTSSDIEVLDGASLKVAKTLGEVIKHAHSINIQHLWLVGGGKLAASLVKNGLLTHLSISEMPITLGSGIALIEGYDFQALVADKAKIVQKRGFKQIDVCLSDIKQ